MNPNEHVFLTRTCSRLAAFAVGILLTAGWSGIAHAQLVSTRLTDTIKSQGVGTIDLLKDVTPAQLEAFRLQHKDSQGRAMLVFGIDVNEAASGTEKASAQGVTIASMKLTVTRSTGTQTYSDFFTETKALLAPNGSTTRSWYYTALGESGSSRITSANAIQSQFDSTLSLRVPDDLSTASAAVLEVRLLQVNMSLGDPEAFYDFSGGYEDLALLTKPDAVYINTVVPTETSFRTDSPTVELTAPVPDPLTVASWTYYPSATGYYFVAYEDNYPQRGDYDFNDLVVAYRYRLGLNASGQVVAMHGDAYLVARGAAYTHDWHLKLPLPGTAVGTLTCQLRLGPQDGGTRSCAPSGQFTGSPDIVAFADTGAIFKPSTPDPALAFAVNTPRSTGFVQGPHAEFEVTLSAPVAASGVGVADPWVYVRSTGRSIRLAEIDPSYKDAAGFPFGLRLPPGWAHPYEGVDLGVAYPSFKTFVQSSGSQAQTWYQSPVQTATFAIGSSWKWAP